MAESTSKLNPNAVAESGAEMSLTSADGVMHYYGDDSSLTISNNGHRIARDAAGEVVGEMVPTVSKRLMNGLASSISRYILRKTK